MPLRVARLIALVLSAALIVPAAVLAATSPLGDSVAAWPASFTTYTKADGSPISDAENESGISPASADIGSNTQTSSSVFLASDGTTVFFRIRTMADPTDASHGGYSSNFWLVQIATANDDTVRAVVGLNGKGSGANLPAGADYVYVSDAAGTATRIYETPFTGTSAGARTMADGNGQYVIDFQVPLARLTTASGGTVTATTPIKLFFGSSAAANLATINKDFMIGTAVSFAGLGTTSLAPAKLALTASAALVSGSLQATQATVYDVTITATNAGGAALNAPSIAFAAGSGVTITTTTSATGSIGNVGQNVTWAPSAIAPNGGTRTAVVRVSVAPGCDLATAMLQLIGSATGTGTDAGFGTTVVGTASSAVEVGPVDGTPCLPSVDPSPSSSASTDPSPSSSASTDPSPSSSASTDPSPSSSASTDPSPSSSASTDPSPSASASTDPSPSSSASTDPSPSASASASPSGSPSATPSDPGTSPAGSSTPSTAPSTSPSSRPGEPGIATDRKVVSRNGKIKVSAKGFEPGSEVELWLTSDPVLLGTFAADEAGEVHETVDIPDNAELGNHHIVATGSDPAGDALRLREAVTVLAPPETDTTGQVTNLPLILGLLTLVMTVALVVRPGRLTGRRAR